MWDFEIKCLMAAERAATPEEKEKLRRAFAEALDRAIADGMFSSPETGAVKDHSIAVKVL